MNLRHLSDAQLHETTIEVATCERKATLETLHHLREIERRRLYSKYQCSSLHAYCVKVLKFSESQAGRRVSASRLLRDLPAIEEKMLDGSLNLTNVAQAGVFFSKEKRAGQTFDNKQKLDLMSDLESQSTRKADQILISKSLQPEIHLRESIKQKTATHTEMRLNFDQDTIDALIRLREIWSNAMPNANFSDVIKRSLLESVERHDPLKKVERSIERSKKSGLELEAFEISIVNQSIALRVGEEPKQNAKPTQKKSFVSHQVRLRDQGRCTFIDPASGERCDSKHFIEEDHIIPKAMGGEYSVENIRLKCRAHNQRHAINTYGSEKMSQYFGDSH